MNLNKKTLLVIGGFLLAFIVILAIGIVIALQPGKSKVVAKVGGQKITKTEVDAELSAFKNLALVTNAERDAATKYLVDCQIASLEGEKNNIAVTEEEVNTNIKTVIGKVYNDYSDKQQQVTQDHIKCELTKQKVQEKEVTAVNGDYLALNILESANAKKTEDAAKKIADDLNNGTTTFAVAKAALEADPAYGIAAMSKYNPVISETFDKYYFQNNMGIFSDSGLKKDTINAINSAGSSTTEKTTAKVKAFAAKQTLSKIPASSMNRWVVVQINDFSSNKYYTIPEYQKALYKTYKASYLSSETNKNIDLATLDSSINTDQTNWFDKNTYYIRLTYLDKTGVRQPIILKPAIKESAYVTDSLEVKAGNNFLPLGNGFYVTQDKLKSPTMIALINNIDPSVAENFPDDSFTKDGYWQWLRKDKSTEKEVKTGNEVYDTATLNGLKNNGVTTMNEFLWVPKYQIVPMIAMVGPSNDALVQPEGVGLVAQVTNTELETQTKLKFRYRMINEKIWQESDWTPRFFGDNRVNREYSVSNLNQGKKYEWQVKAIDQKGVESDWTSSMTFYALSGKQSGQADCKMSSASKLPGSSADPLSVTLTGKGENIGKYAWDFGDNSGIVEQETTAQIKHQYPASGRYTASSSGYKYIESVANTLDNVLFGLHLKKKTPIYAGWLYCGTKSVSLTVAGPADK
ncbi:MAG: SurA N-terminal domain-containing protein [Patescibacteria group bacterium]|nr:SurA N-terminal domain-containing protein [Patescibacteria group bacterium]